MLKLRGGDTFETNKEGRDFWRNRGIFRDSLVFAPLAIASWKMAGLKLSSKKERIRKISETKRKSLKKFQTFSKSKRHP